MHLELEKMTASSTSAKFLSNDLDPLVFGKYTLHEQGSLYFMNKVPPPFSKHDTFTNECKDALLLLLQ